MRVESVPGTRTGRILRLERVGQTPVAIIDLGSGEGLRVGSLVSIGGLEAGGSIWEVVSVREVYCRAQPQPGQDPGSAARGDRVQIVRPARIE